MKTVRVFGLARAGCAYLALVLPVSLEAVRTGGNTLYALLAVMLSAIVVSSIISRNTLKQLALTLQTPDRIFAGKTVTTRVSLTNTKRLFPSLAIFVEEMKPDVKNTQTKQHNAAFFPILRAGETRSARLEQTFPRRGRRRQTLQVATRFPFGFFQRRDPLPSQELLVYPAPGDVPEFLQTDVLCGRRESRRRGPGENFYSIREYQDGESARAIDWKATAKARKLMAREYAGDDEFRCLLILDTYEDSSKKGEPEDIGNNDLAGELFEKAVSLAAGLAARFINDGASVEFLTPEIHIPANSGERHLYRILEALAVTRRQTAAELCRSTGSGLLVDRQTRRTSPPFPVRRQARRQTKPENFAIDPPEVIANPLGTRASRPQIFENASRMPAPPGKTGGFAITPPAVDLQKLVSNHAFSVILTPLTEESFPVGIRRFARIITFENTV